MNKAFEEVGKPEDSFRGIFRGEVVDNQDPLKLGRVRVKVYDFMCNLTAADTPNIPWAVPAFPLGAGGAGSNVGCFSIPRLASKVFVFFEGMDHHQPVYFAEAPDGVAGQPTLKTAGYPNTRGFRLQNGVEFYMNEDSGEVKFTHPSGTFIVISPTGKVTVNAVEDIEAISLKNIKATASLDIEAIALKNIKATAALDIEATATQNIKANATLNLEAVAGVEAKVSAPGGMLDIAPGGVTLNATGNMMISAAGSITIAPGGALILAP